MSYIVDAAREDEVINRPITTILAPAQTDIASADVIDLAVFGAILADYTAVDGRHLIFATRQGKVWLWVHTPQVDTLFVVIIPADQYFITRAAAVARFARSLSSTLGEFKPSAFCRVSYNATA